LLVLGILITEKSRVRDRFISYSKYSRRGTLFIQKKVGSALTETENWDLLVDCTSRDGRQILDAGVHLSDKRTLLQRLYDHDYCAHAFSQVNLLLRVVMG
jgi:hypothetical protein